MCDKQHYEDLVKDLAALKLKLEHVEESTSKTRGEIASLREDVNISVGKFITQLSTIEKGNKDIIDAWNTASGFVKFVKWFAGLMGAVWSIYYMITHWGIK